MKSTFFSAVAIFLFMFAFATPAYSQSVPVASGSWSNASIWNTPPVNNGSVQLTGGYTVTFGPGDSYTGSPTWFNGLGVGNGTPGTLNITGGTLTTGAWYAGHQTTGTINLSGGSLIANGNQMLFGWTNTATMNITGGTMSMTGAGTYNIGHTAQSFINVSGNGVANFAGGMNVLNNSQINNNGGTVTINPTTQIVVQVGGSINQTAGTTTSGSNLWLGANATTGTLNLSGGTWSQTGFMRMGVFGSGNGIINQTSGTFEMGSTFEVWAGSKSSYNLNGGTFRVTGAGVAINNASGGMDFNITGASNSVTVDTGANNFTAPNTSTFDNAAATLTKIGSGTLTFSGGEGQLQVVNGALDMQAGTIETQSTLSIGASNGTASGTMTGGRLRTGYLAASNFAVGNSGTGSFTQSGGTVDVGAQANIVVGWNSAGLGTYTLTGGTFTTGSNTMYVGLSGGSGTVNVNGGNFSANSLNIGGNSAAAGTLNLSGGTFGVASSFNVGASGTVNVNSGGSLRGGASNNLGLTNGGLIKFNGGTGNASMNILAGNGGRVDANGQTLAAGSWGNLVASGSGAVITNSSASNATISNGNTIWIWDGGQNVTIDTPAGALDIASRITSSGQTTATGVIKTGTGVLVLSGNVNDYTGTTQVNQGTLQITIGNALGSTGTAAGTIVANGARLLLSSTSGNISVGNEPLTISGTGLNGWVLRSATSSNTWGGKITLAADSTIQAATGAGLTLDVASGDAVDLGSFIATFNGAGTHTVNDPIVGSGGVTKAGSGSLTLGGNSTYTGATTVSLGKLFVNGNNSAATGTVTIDSAATLGGSGTIGGAVTVNGILSPGNSPGVLSLASLELGGSSTSLFEINGTTRGTAYDGVNITGATAPSYSGTLLLSFGNSSAFADNTTFDLFSFTGSPTGDFSSVTSTGFYPGTWTLSSGTWKLESGSQTLSFSPATGDIVVVPEPGALALAGLGIVVAAWACRRR